MNQDKPTNCSVDHQTVTTTTGNEAKLSSLQEKPTLRYYYDALCGWCFGFSSVMARLHEEYKEHFEFDVLSGGLFLNERAGRGNQVAPHIRSGAYKLVENTTGVKFGKAFLDDIYGEGKITLDSLLPAIALIIVKESYPEQSITFAKLLLDAVYVDGMNSIDLEAYTPYATQVGFDAEIFSKKMKDKTYKAAALSEFAAFQRSSIGGFPALVLENGEEKTLISSGYASYENLKSRLDTYLNN